MHDNVVITDLNYYLMCTIYIFYVTYSPVADWFVLSKVVLAFIKCFIGVYGTESYLESG